MKTQTTTSLAPRTPSRDRWMALALGLLVTGVTLGACDTRTVVALTIVARPAAFNVPLERLPDTLDLLVRGVGLTDDCKTYSLIPPDGGAPRFEVDDGGRREARLLYYPNVDEGTLALNVAVYDPGSALGAGARGQGTVTLIPHQPAYVQIDLSGAFDVSTICRDLPRPDLRMENDLSPPPDLTTVQDLATTDMAIDKQDLSRPADLLVEVPDATTPPRDLSVIDANPLYDLAITDASFPYDLAVTDGDPTTFDLGPFPYDLTVTDASPSPFDLNTTSELGQQTNLCDDGNPCTYDTTIPIAGGGYTCQNDPAAQGTLCRPVAGPCDAPESCDGIGKLCPPDISAPICNGNFDFNTTGDSWTFAGRYNQVTSNDAPCLPLSGPSYNLLCNAPGCQELTYQALNLPPGRGARVVFWLAIPYRSPLLIENDFFAEVLEDRFVKVQLPLNSGRILLPTYQQYVLDVPASQSLSRTLQFRAQTPTTYSAAFCLDNVSVFVN